MFDPRPLCCSSLTTAVGGTTDTNFVDSAHPTVARINDLLDAFRGEGPSEGPSTSREHSTTDAETPLPGSRAYGISRGAED